MLLPLVPTEERGGVFDAEKSDGVVAALESPAAGPELPPSVHAVLAAAVAGNPLFDALSGEERALLLGTMAPLKVPDRTILIHQGDPKADTFYILESGTCVALVDGTPVKDYSAGGTFGELSLLFSKPRAATVTCTSDCVLWVLRRSVYNAVRAHNRKGVEDQYALLLERAPGLKCLSELTRSELMRGLREESFAKGARLPAPDRGLCWVLAGIAAGSDGDLVPPNHYGTLSGTDPNRPRAVTDVTCVSLSRSTIRKLLGPADQLAMFDSLRTLPMLFPLRVPQLFRLATLLQEQPLYSVRRGARFKAELMVVSAGELEHNGVRVHAGACAAGAVRASVDAEVRTLDAASIEAVLALRAAAADWRLRAVRTLPELAHLTDKQARAVCASLREHRLPQDTEIVRAGEEVPGCFIVQSGVCRMGDVELGSGTHFGGWAMLGRRAADAVVAITDVVLLPVEPDQGYSVPRLEELHFVCELGAGSYGRVMMVSSEAGRMFALKRLDKRQIKDNNMTLHVKREKVLHSQCSSDFVTRMWGSYNQGAYLYMLMDCLQHGDLFTHMRHVGVMSEDHARFYVACVVCGLEHLHARRIAWRDLKPENLLLDELGYLKLTDMGFACTLRLGQRTRTLCGTPEFLAPEIVLKHGHTMAVDWWALGILAYELVAGRTPFVNAEGGAGSGMRVFKNIIRGAFRCPPKFSPRFVDFITRLLDQDQARRLGSGIAGAVEVKDHAWFHGFDWAALHARTMCAPYAPAALPPISHQAGGVQPTPDKYESVGTFADF